MTLASVQQALEPLGLLGYEPRLIAKTMAVKLLSGPALIVLAGAPG